LRKLLTSGGGLPAVIFPSCGSCAIIPNYLPVYVGITGNNFKRETSDFDAIQKDCVGFVQQFVVFPPTKENQKPLYPMESFW
jgi:hypothetical protein